ncbi:MAG: hypothetical protein M3Y56_00860 [Armatimonadota bacterium]|nr:hypothetical protein [Armatimonadota bacterium]
MIDTERIEALARTLDNSPVEELVLVEEGTEIRFRRSPFGTGIPISPPPPLGEAEEEAADEGAILSRRVGVYHNPQRPVHPGDRIEAGEIVGFIEAMRILNEVVAEFSGTVTQVCVEEGSPVEYGQELMILKEVVHASETE